MALMCSTQPAQLCNNPFNEHDRTELKRSMLTLEMSYGQLRLKKFGTSVLAMPCDRNLAFGKVMLENIMQIEVIVYVVCSIL